MHHIIRGAAHALLLLPLGACTAPLDPGEVAIASALASPDTPAVFAPGVISDGRWQWRLTFTSDARTAYFTVSDAFFPATRRGTIMVSHYTPSGWSTPAVAPFSGVYSDIDPFISPDGQRLYFSSIRPVDGVERVDLDLWVVERTPDGWSEPRHLGPSVNSPIDELYPSVSASGTLFFASGPFGPTPAADWDLYSAERDGDGFAAREAIDALNTDLPFSPTNPTADWEFNPEIARDGRTLVFTSLRPGGYGAGDLYVSHLGRAGWGTPSNLGPLVNTADDEFHPTLSGDGRTLFFARTIFAPVFTPSDFYSVSTRELTALRVR